MTWLPSPMRRLGSETTGSVVIETAFVVPLLAILALGGFEASRIVARQVELQTAASEAAAIVLANPPDKVEERNTLKSVIIASTNLTDAGQVVLASRYRCGSAEVLAMTPNVCADDDVVSEYILLTLRDSYTPIWTSFGVGNGLNYRVRRRVQIS